MNVRTHAALLQGFGILMIPVTCYVMNTTTCLLASLPLDSLLEGTVVRQFNGLLIPVITIATYIGVLFCLGWFFKRLLWIVFARVLPARCHRQGCPGRSHLTQHPKSYVYVCDVCGDIYDTHFQIGGDD